MPVPAPADPAGLDDEIAALELSRRASATDVGGATVMRLELAVDGLAIAVCSLVSAQGNRLVGTLPSCPKTGSPLMRAGRARPGLAGRGPVGF